MDFDMPPAPGEFVAPEHAPAHAPTTAAIVPVSTGAPGSAQPPSFQELQAQAFAQMQAQVQAQQQQLAALRAQQAEMMQHAARPVGDDAAAAGGGETSLGITILAVAAGAVLGSSFAGGLAGAAGGALLGAAAANGFKAAKAVTKGDEAADKAAMVDGSFALGGAALGAYLLYQARKGKTTATPNESDDEAEDEPDTEGAEEGSDEAKTDHTPLPKKPPGVKVTPLFARKLHKKKKRKKAVANVTPIAALTTGNGDE